MSASDDGPPGRRKYSAPHKQTRLPAIAGFLRRARRELGRWASTWRRRLRLHRVHTTTRTSASASRSWRHNLDYFCRWSIPPAIRWYPGVPEPSRPLRGRPRDVRLIQQRGSHTRRAGAAVDPGLSRLCVRPADLRRSETRADQRADDAGASAGCSGPGTTNPGALRQKEALGTK